MKMRGKSTEIRHETLSESVSCRALVVVGCYCCRSRSYTMTTNRTHCETVTAPCATHTPAPTPGTRVAPIIRARRVTAAKSRVPSERHGEGQLWAVGAISTGSPRLRSSPAGWAAPRSLLRGAAAPRPLLRGVGAGVVLAPGWPRCGHNECRGGRTPARCRQRGGAT
jgi:hypothetical protein